MVNFLNKAPAKALATTGSEGINVVPVSALNVTETVIYLYDFFMNKTAVNLKEANTVALTSWEGMKGLQIKAEVDYQTEGAEFESANAWAQATYPERILKGLIILTPQAVYDVSVGPKVLAEDSK
jgi:predicted pyridoxine 5'-phosphate oxidase superfamily flavin-nucleotide-binding protein